VMVQTYDVTSLLAAGKNTIGAVLGDGWYAGRLGWMGLAQYGTRPVFNAQIEITYADGTRDIIATENSWQAGPGEIVGSDQQWGEIIDARKSVPDWNQPSFKDPSWADAVVEPHDVALVPQLGPPVRRLLELAPQKITHWGDAWIVDFGQNLVGCVRLAARGRACAGACGRAGRAGGQAAQAACAESAVWRCSSTARGGTRESPQGRAPQPTGPQCPRSQRGRCGRIRQRTRSARLR